MNVSGLLRDGRVVCFFVLFFINNFLTVRDSAMKLCMHIDDGRYVFFFVCENMKEIKCLLKSYQKRPHIFITSRTGSLLRRFKYA